MSNSTISPNAPYKEIEFQAFLKTLKEGQHKHWYEIATALNVDRKTILAWKQTPEAQAIINTELDEALSNMKATGKRDWRMWRERAKILGLADRTELDVTSGGKPIPILSSISTDAIQKNDSDNKTSET